MARRTRCSRNHADFWVMPSERAISWEETPFLALAMIHIAASHLSSGMAESSKMLPTLTENWRLQPLHFHSRRVVR
jgi:hypothetical protein